MKSLFFSSWVILFVFPCQAFECVQKLAWLSDSHFEFLTQEQRHEMGQAWKKIDFDLLLISGDISAAPFVIQDLKSFQEQIKRPIAFVLGNHDYYAGSGSMQSQRDRVTRFSESHPEFVYLSSQQSFISLNSKTALVGFDGWASGPWPFDLEASESKDFEYIGDLKESNELNRAVRELSRFGLLELLEKTRKAFDEHEEAILVTHVPAVSDQADFDPHRLFVNESLEAALVQLMREYPHRRLRILAGHTHRESLIQILPNLTQQVAGAEYRRPQSPQVFDIQN